MVKKLTLGKQERLKSRKLIEQLFKGGKSFTVFPYRAYYLLPEIKALKTVSKSSDGGNHLLQFGVGVSSKHFKHAVDRNRIKRLTREAYRLQKIPLQELIQLKRVPFALFLVYTGKELPVYEVVSEKIAVILNRLIKTANEIPASDT
jgi:ribonuclease P protein component